MKKSVVLILSCLPATFLEARESIEARIHKARKIIEELEKEKKHDKFEIPEKRHLSNQCHLEIVVNARDKKQRTPIMVASLEGNIKAVESLLELEANTNLTDDNENTVWMWAARGGSLDILKALLSNGSKVNTKDGSGETPLIWAAAYGHGPAVNLLLKNGALPNEKSLIGRTALMAAAENGYVDIIKALVNAGANINEQNADGCNALMIAVMEDKTNVVNYLLTLKINYEKDKNKNTPLIKAAMNGSLQMVNLLLNRVQNSEINAQNGDGESAIMAAVRSHKIKVVERLIKTGAKLDLKNKEGKTALDIANELKRDQIAGVLKDALNKKTN